VTLTPAQWFAIAREAYDEVLIAMSRHGIAPDPALEFVPAEAPTPYYEPATRTIGVGMPDPATVKGRLYWLYAARVLGYGGVDEVVARQAEQMPFMIAHEVAHHLRQHYGAPIANDFVEEQVANAIALAFVHEHPTYRDRLPAMREAASKATVTLSLLTPEAVPFVGGFRMSNPDALLELDKLTAGELRDLELLAAAADVPVEDLLVEAGIVSGADLIAAGAARDGAQAYFNTGYMTNLLEYGYFHMAWISAYLGRADSPSLAETVKEYLLTPDWEHARQSESRLLIRQLLRDAPDEIAPAVVETLTDVTAGETVADLLDVLPLAVPQTEAAILLGLARHAADHPRAVEAACARAGSPYPEVRGAAGVLLERSPAGGGPGRGILLTLLQSAGSEDRRAGLRGAAELGDPAMFEAVAACLRSDDAEMRRLALEALEKLPPKSAVGQRVTPAMADGDDMVRAAAIRCMGRHPSPAGLTVLLGAFDDPVESVRREAVAAIAQHPAAASALRALGGGWRARTEAALLLQGLDDPGAASRLDDVMTELVASVRSLARPLPVGGSGQARASLLENVVVEQRRKLCFLVLRVVAARRQGHALDDVLEALRWGDPSTRPGLLRLIRRTLPPDLWPLLDGAPPHGETRPMGLPPLTPQELDALLAGFEPFLRALAVDCLHRPTTEEDSMLSDLERLVFLRTIPLFRDVELVDLRRLAQACEVYRYRAGETVFEQGDEGDRLYLVTAGRVAVEQRSAAGSPVRLRELGPGAYFGETAFFADIPRTAAVSAIADATLLGLRREPVVQTGIRHPAILLAMIRAMSERMADSSAVTRL
jgi:HEAT repeat protein